jgi:hypothetical protein
MWKRKGQRISIFSFLFILLSNLLRASFILEIFTLLEEEIKHNEIELNSNHIDLNYINPEDIIDITNNFINIKEDLFNYLDELNNYNGLYTIEINYKDTKAKYESVKNRKEIYNKYLDEVEHELKHLIALKTDDNKVEELLGIDGIKESLVNCLLLTKDGSWQ